MSVMLIVIAVAIVVLILSIVGILSRYRKCGSNQILVIFGKTGNDNRSAKCIQGGAAFIWPIIQGYDYMSLEPLQFDCDLKKALSSQNIRVDVPTTVTVAIDTNPDVMQNAAERLLGINTKGIEELVKDIVYGQLRTIVADLTIEELNADRDKFLDKSKTMINTELAKLGLTLINMNITDIRDEAGYIAALGEKDKAIALNAAEVEIAKAETNGAIKVSEQQKIKNSEVAGNNRDEKIALSEANRQEKSKIAELESAKESEIAEHNKNRTISVSKSNADGEIGKIKADKEVIDEEALLEVAKSEASGRMASAEEIAKASVEENKERSNQKAEEAKKERTRIQLEANVIVPAEIAKRNTEISADAYAIQLEKEAEGEKNSQITKAEGESQSKVLEGQAEAKVINEIGTANAEAKEKSLMAEANGFKAMISAAEENPQVAIQYKLVNQYKEIAGEQVKAFEKMNFGNITVMDTTGGSTTTDLMKGLLSTISPTLDVMKSMEIPGISKTLRNASKEDEKKEEGKPSDSEFEEVK